jgi:2-keto-4-pentenoate hydratase
MTPEAIERAAAAIDAADRNGTRLEHLPDGCAPGSAADALAVQERVVALSGQTIAGWKIARPDETAVWGTIYVRDIHDAPARVPAGRYPLRGVEAEIAYRFRRDLPRGAGAVSAERLAELFEAVPVFEIVDSRFADYRGTPAVHRLCDRMSNGGLVIGRWNGTPPGDFAAMVVRLDRDGETVFEGAGGHVRKDPLIPALEFIAAEHEHRDFRAGQILATGTFSGLVFGSPGESYHADFGERGQVEITFANAN